MDKIRKNLVKSSEKYYNKKTNNICLMLRSLMNMKKMIACLMLVSLALSITACGKGEGTKANIAEPLIKLSGSTVEYSTQEIVCH